MSNNNNAKDVASFWKSITTVGKFQSKLTSAKTTTTTPIPIEDVLSEKKSKKPRQEQQQQPVFALKHYDDNIDFVIRSKKAAPLDKEEAERRLERLKAPKNAKEAQEKKQQEKKQQQQQQQQQQKKQKQQKNPERAKTLVKTIFSSPYNLTWPSIQSTDSSAIFSALQRKFSGIIRNDRKRKRQQQDEDKEKHDRELLSELCFGVNEVTKALEKRQLRLVIVTSVLPTPPILVQHLPVLAHTMDVPLCPVETSEKLATLFGMNTLLTFGFKIKNGESELDDLVKYIIQRSPKYDYPWIPLQPDIAHQKKQEQLQEEQQAEQEGNSSSSNNNNKRESKTAAEKLVPLHISQKRVPLPVRKNQKRPATTTAPAAAAATKK